MSGAEQPTTQLVVQPAARVVVVGASNVAMNWQRIFTICRQASGGPLDFLMAMGHGRGYSRDSLVLGRWLPPILDCELWPTLSERPPLPASAPPIAAVLTDVGNDLLYGASAAEVAVAVRECLQRLTAHASQLILTGLPLENIRELGPARFGLLRTLLFPRSRLTLATAQREAEELDAALRSLAAEFSAAHVRPPAAWYGVDPIHVRRRWRAAAWQAILAPWLPAQSLGACGSAHAPQRARFGVVRPARRRLWGVSQRAAQPCARADDASCVSWF